MHLITPKATHITHRARIFISPSSVRYSRAQNIFQCVLLVDGWQLLALLLRLTRRVLLAAEQWHVAAVESHYLSYTKHLSLVAVGSWVWEGALATHSVRKIKSGFMACNWSSYLSPPQLLFCSCSSSCTQHPHFDTGTGNSLAA